MERLGKPGRPRKDPVAERVRIYRAAGPLVLRRGVRRTTVRDVARASHLSPGGIYHYFRSKADLVLYGLEPEALERACTEAMRESGGAHDATSSTGSGPADVAPPGGAVHGAASFDPAPAAPDIVLDRYVGKTLDMIDFVRPALQAAVELGRPELRRRLEVALRDDADALLSVLRSLRPAVAHGPDAAGALRRTILGLALDESATPSEARGQLHWFFEELLAGAHREETPGRRRKAAKRAGSATGAGAAGLPRRRATGEVRRGPGRT